MDLILTLSSSLREAASLLLTGHHVASTGALHDPHVRHLRRDDDRRLVLRDRGDHLRLGPVPRARCFLHACPVGGVVRACSYIYRGQPAAGEQTRWRHPSPPAAGRYGGGGDPDAAGTGGSAMLAGQTNFDADSFQMAWLTMFFYVCGTGANFETVGRERAAAVLCRVVLGRHPPRTRDGYSHVRSRWVRSEDTPRDRGSCP